MSSSETGRIFAIFGVVRWRRFVRRIGRTTSACLSRRRPCGLSCSNSVGIRFNFELFRTSKSKKKEKFLIFEINNIFLASGCQAPTAKRIDDAGPPKFWNSGARNFAGWIFNDQRRQRFIGSNFSGAGANSPYGGAGSKWRPRAAGAGPSAIEYGRIPGWFECRCEKENGKERKNAIKRIERYPNFLLNKIRLKNRYQGFVNLQNPEIPWRFTYP